MPDGPVNVPLTVIESESNGLETDGAPLTTNSATLHCCGVFFGVMTMAPYHADETALRRVFQGARQAVEALRVGGHSQARELSMGMSDDFEIAVEEGATCVRLGTVLFGARTRVA